MGPLHRVAIEPLGCDHLVGVLGTISVIALRGEGRLDTYGVSSERPPLAISNDT